MLIILVFFFASCNSLHSQLFSRYSHNYYVNSLANCVSKLRLIFQCDNAYFLLESVDFGLVSFYVYLFHIIILIDVFFEVDSKYTISFWRSYIVFELY